ncbi:MAG: ABC transporter substrate-binding protein [Planctomycetota bacterium]
MLSKTLLFLFASVFTVVAAKESLIPQDSVAQMTLRLVPQGFDPIASSDFVDAIVQRQVFECLTEYDYEAADDTIQGLLATSWEVSEDRLTWTFELNPEARFYDPYQPALWKEKTRPVVAQDVLASWLRMADARQDGKGYWAYEGLFLGLDAFRNSTAALDPAKADAAFAKALKEGVEGIQVLGEHRLQLKLHYADAHLLKRLAMTHFQVYPLEACTTEGRTLADQPVGSAPYFLDLWVPGQTIGFQRTPDWRGQESSAGDGVLPHMDRFELHVTRQGDTAPVMFDRGVLARMGVSAAALQHFFEEDRAQLKKEFADRGIQAFPTVHNDITMLQFQMDDAVVGRRPGDEEGNRKRRLVRQALALCFPYKEWQDNARGALPATLAQNFLPPHMSDAAGTPKNSWNKTDLVQAKALLAKAGYPGGQGLQPILFGTGNDPVSQDIAERFQGNAAAIGIPLEIDTVAWNKVNDNIRSGNYQVFLRAWVMDYADASLILQSFYGPNAGSETNFSNFRDEAYDAHFRIMRSSLPGEKRSAALTAMLDILNTEVPSVPIDHRKGWVLAQPQLQNFHVHPYEYLPLKHYVWVQD